MDLYNYLVNPSTKSKLYESNGMKCFLERFKENIETLICLGNNYSGKELARNRVYDMYQDNENPVCIDLVVTNVCNGHCFFCQASGSHEDSREYLSLNDFERFIGNQGIHLTITGGEPLVRGAYVEKLIKVVKKTRKSTICLLTNLSLLNNKEIETLKQCFGYFDVVQVSVYSDNPMIHKKICGRDDWKQINENIQQLVKEGIPVRANLTVNKYNVLDIEKIYKFYMNLGVEHICISCLLNKGLAQKMVDEEYVLNYVFETAKFVKSGYQNYNIAVPIEALRGYHHCIELIGGRTVDKLKEANGIFQKLKLYINYDGELFYSESKEWIGNIKTALLSEIAAKSVYLGQGLCSTCNALPICGGRVQFDNGVAAPYCSLVQ